MLSCVFFYQIIVIYTHLNPINLWNRAINIFISLLIHLFLLFATIRHYSSLSSLFVTIRHYSSLFVTTRHYSRLFALFGHYSGFITSRWREPKKHHEVWLWPFRALTRSQFTVILCLLICINAEQSLVKSTREKKESENFWRTRTLPQEVSWPRQAAEGKLRQTPSEKKRGSPEKFVKMKDRNSSFRKVSVLSHSNQAVLTTGELPNEIWFSKFKWGIKCDRT